MERFVLLSLISLIIFCAFRGISVFNARKHKNIINESFVQEESALEKNDNEYGRPTGIFIPNVLARWPWRRRINPNYSVVKKESDAWMMSFQAFSPKAQDAFNRCDPSRYFRLVYVVDILILFDRSLRLFMPSYSQKR